MMVFAPLLGATGSNHWMLEHFCKEIHVAYACWLHSSLSGAIQAAAMVANGLANRDGADIYSHATHTQPNGWPHICAVFRATRVNAKIKL